MQSESVITIGKALIDVQNELRSVVVPMDGKNPFYKSRYTTLGVMIDTVRMVLPKYGLSLSQFPITSSEGTIGVRNYLMHESGEYIVNDVYLPVRMTDRVFNQAIEAYIEKDSNYVQEAGKIITYLRRYSIAGIIGIYGDEDVDGNEVHQVSEEEHPVLRQPLSPENLREVLWKKGELCENGTEKDMQKVAMNLAEHTKTEDGKPDTVLRSKVQEYLFGSPTLTEVSPKLWAAGLAWLKPYKRESGDWDIDPVAKMELKAVIKEVTNG